MADISINKFTSVVKLQGNSASVPSLPPSLEDTPPAVNPPGTGVNPSASTFLQLTDTTASYTGQAGLFPRVNSGETSLEFFNPLSLPLTGYTVGSNTALASTDTILGAFGKVQGQINAKIGGTIASGQVAFGTGINTVGGSANLTYPNTYLIIGGNTSNNGLILNGSSSFLRQIVFSVNSISRWIQNVNQNNFSFSRYNDAGVFIDNPLSIRLSSGFVGIGEVTNPTNTLDVNGTARIRTLSNATGDFVTASATGVLQKRTATGVASDIGAVTITGTQTITGEKTFSNSLLIQEAYAPILRLKTTAETQATINFRNSANEDEAGLQFDAGVGKFSLLTRTNNCDIEIAPHGTGSILLPNVPSGSGDVLMLNGSGEVVKGSGTTQLTGTFTPTMSAVSGGVTYSFTVTNANYVKTGRIVYFSITLSSISSTGTPIGLLQIGGLPFTSVASSGRFWYVGVTQFLNSSLTASQVDSLRGVVGQNSNDFTIGNRMATISAPTFSSSGIISVSGFYETNS